MLRSWILLPALALGALPVSAASELTYVDLVGRLTDLEGLAVLPEPGETCSQWSSYDRASRFDAQSGKYVKWDANGDGDGFIRREGKTQVFAEMEGPGCIWRIWSARPEQGHVRIFLDGAETPAVDLPFIGYFDGKNEPFTRSALVHTVAMGWNNYVPVPYQKSCKIVADDGWGAYFQFVYTTYPKGTKVPTFKRQLSAEEGTALDKANERLLHSGPVAPPAPEESMQESQSSGLPSSITIGGPRAIRTLRVKMDPPFAPEDRAAVREWTVSIRFDGEDQPSVWAPFGDFFGTAAGANAYASLPSGLSAEGWWYSHWCMPFAQKAEIRLANEGSTPRKATLQVVHTPVRGDIGKLGRFHAKWHRDALPPSEPERAAIDWTMLRTEGRGRFLGVMLHVWNPKGGWWGEGDEKFYVDGERFPSTIGTGSEDYFGYAWCNPSLFQNAYHNQTISMGNKGHICVNRWHVTDNIPFMKSFDGAIEKYYPNRKPTLYASTVYWYLAPGGKDPYAPLPLAERTGYWTDIKTFKIKGAIEGEAMKVLSKTGGNPQRQEMTGYEGDWSNEAHLWWTEAKPGDRLDLALSVEKEGKYRLSLQLTKARDYGIVQLLLDGRKLGAPIDLFHPEVVPTGALDMGVQQLSAGQHVLAIEITGANEKAVKSYMSGVDYVKLEPAQ